MIDVSEIIHKLPISMEQRSQFYDIISQFVKGQSPVETMIDNLRQIIVEKDEENHGNHPSIETSVDYQNNLNRIIDELWNLIDEEQYLQYQALFDELRKLFRGIFEKMDDNEHNLRDMKMELELMKEEMKDFNIVHGHLLLGSLSQQILLKIAKFLNRDISLFTALSYSVSDLNNMENINALKSLLENNGFNWRDLQTTIKVLKQNRLASAHPGGSTTTDQEIRSAIEKCFPNPNSEFRAKATQALDVLYLLAGQLNEPLFLSIPY